MPLKMTTAHHTMPQNCKIQNNEKMIETQQSAKSISKSLSESTDEAVKGKFRFISLKMYGINLTA